MFILSKRNIMFRTPDGAQTHFVRRDFVGEVPDWVGKTKYFKQLVADGVIAVPASTKDADVQPAAESAPVMYPDSVDATETEQNADSVDATESEKKAKTSRKRKAE